MVSSHSKTQTREKNLFILNKRRHLLHTTTSEILLPFIRLLRLLINFFPSSSFSFAKWLLNLRGGTHTHTLAHKQNCFIFFFLILKIKKNVFSFQKPPARYII